MPDNQGQCPPCSPETYLPNPPPIAQLKPGAEAEYTRLHAAVWPGVLAALARAHITDYTIHHAASLGLLIAHFTYTGTDFAGDMRRVGEDAETRRWWALTDGLQESFNPAAAGSGGMEEWWTVRLDFSAAVWESVGRLCSWICFLCLCFADAAGGVSVRRNALIYGEIPSRETRYIIHGGLKNVIAGVEKLLYEISLRGRQKTVGG